jgi:hypothetical protein
MFQSQASFSSQPETAKEMWQVGLPNVYSIRNFSAKDLYASFAVWVINPRFGEWNFRSLCRRGSLKTVRRKLGKYKLGFLGVK